MPLDNILWVLDAIVSVLPRASTLWTIPSMSKSHTHSTRLDNVNNDVCGFVCEFYWLFAPCHVATRIISQWQNPRDVTFQIGFQLQIHLAYSFKNSYPSNSEEHSKVNTFLNIPLSVQMYWELKLHLVNVSLYLIDDSFKSREKSWMKVPQ